MNLSKDKFKKLMDEIMDHYKTVSLSDLDVLKLVKHKAKCLLYKDLEKYNTIDEALGKHGALFLLYETSPQYGHWCAVFRRNKDTINFFDSYGTFPDQELYWVNKNTRKHLGQNIPYLSHLLLKSKNTNLEYNDYKYQKSDKNISTCGRWAAIRIILRDLTCEQFQKVFGTKDSDKLVTLVTEIIS